MTQQTIKTTDADVLLGMVNTRPVKVSIPATAIKTLAASPYTLVAAPGADKVIEFKGALLKLVYGSEVLAAGAGDDLAVKYVDGSGDQVSANIETTTFLTATADTQTSALAVIDTIVASADAENQALVLHNLGSEFTGNVSDDAVLEVYVSYVIHDVA